MVVSLASDKSVWEAVMNNEAVRELRESVNEANKSTSGRDAEPSEGSVPLSDILEWIFINTKAKVIEVLEKL
nr:protein deltex like [Tanacetum cinerariifolium]